MASIVARKSEALVNKCLSQLDITDEHKISEARYGA
jgi:hypothetical protein